MHLANYGDNGKVQLAIACIRDFTCGRITDWQEYIMLFEEIHVNFANKQSGGRTGRAFPLSYQQ